MSTIQVKSDEVKADEILLSTGVWPCDEVRPDHWAEYFRNAGPEPERPFKMADGIDGPEKVTLPDDDPQWELYHRAVNDYNLRTQEFLWMMAFRRVVVPKDWMLPEGEKIALNILPVDSPQGRKLQYLRFHVLGTRADVSLVAQCAEGVISREERAAGGKPFPGADGDEAGRVGPAGSDPAGSAQDVSADGEL